MFGREGPGRVGGVGDPGRRVPQPELPSPPQLASLHIYLCYCRRVVDVHRVGQVAQHATEPVPGLGRRERAVELGEVAAVYHRRPTPYAVRYAHLPAALCAQPLGPHRTV